MATKAEERKALEQIKQIVEGLGEESYIGFALEGMFEDAEYNIDNDCAMSWCNRAQVAGKQIAEAKDTIQCRENELADKEKEIRDLRKTVETLTSEKLELLERLKKTEETGMQIVEERSALQVKCNEQEDEILHLKAKLYDLMTGKEN